MADQHTFRSRGVGYLNLFLNTGQQHRFSFVSPYPTTVVVRARDESERIEDPSWDTEFAYEAERPISEPLAQSLNILASGRMPPGSRDHRNGIQDEHGTTQFYPSVRDDGTFDPGKPAELDLLPAELAELFYGGRRVDALHALRIAAVIDWRYGSLNGRFRLKSNRTEWSVSADVWRPWPGSLHIEVASRSGIRIGEQTREWINRRVEEGLGQPPAHELIREAEDIQAQSERGALVLAAAAFETGVKSCVIAIAPETEWLLQQRAAPQALQLLNSYLPTLAPRVAGRHVYDLPKSIYRLLESGLRLRNSIVHENAEVTDAKLTRRFRRLVRDLLYLMDAYRGETWALRRITPQTQELLGISGGNH